jgi:hypothetical protein
MANTLVDILGSPILGLTIGVKTVKIVCVIFLDKRAEFVSSLI